MESQRNINRTSTETAAAENSSSANPSTTNRAELARRLRNRFAWLNRLSDEELELLSVCEGGASLVPGETYFDLSDPEKGTFVGTANTLIPEGGCLVRQGDVPPRIWQKVTRFP